VLLLLVVVAALLLRRIEGWCGRGDGSGGGGGCWSWCEVKWCCVVADTAMRRCVIAFVEWKFRSIRIQILKSIPVSSINV